MYTQRVYFIQKITNPNSEYWLFSRERRKKITSNEIKIKKILESYKLQESLSILGESNLHGKMICKQKPRGMSDISDIWANIILAQSAKHVIYIKKDGRNIRAKEIHYVTC